jgi:hypothetical protein
MKNKKVKNLEFAFCWSLSLEFISKLVIDIRNPLTYNRKKTPSKLTKNTNSISPLNMRNFGIQDPFRPFLEIKYQHYFMAH